MEEEGYINQSEKENALRQPIYLSTMRKGIEANNYFTEYIRKYLEDTYGPKTVYKGNLRVYTTLDRKAQLSAARAVQEGLRELDKRRGWRGIVEQKSELDVEKEMRTKELSSIVVSNPGDIYPGLF